MKVLFTPISMSVGMLAGLLAKKLFTALWGRLDDEQPPDPKHREISYEKMILALVLEGALVRLIRGVVDHGLRQAFARTTGSWPGEERPEPE